MRRSAYLVVAAVLAIGAAVFVASRERGGEPSETSADGPGRDAEDNAPAPTPGAHSAAAASAGQRGACAIEGGVFDADGAARDVAVECVRLGDEPPPTRPRAAAWIDVFSVAARSPAPSWRGTTDAAGRFRSDSLAPGHWRVVARADDGRGASAIVTVASRADAQVEIRLPAPGFSVRGRVEGADGAPVAARVAVQEVTERGFAPDEFPRLAWTDTTPDGAFVLAGIAAARVNVVASAGAEVVSVGPVTLPREEQLVVRFGDGVTRRRGLVRDAATKAPVAGARISWIAWTDGEGRTVGTQATSGADGRFELPGLARGRGYAEAAGFVTEEVWDRGGADEIVVELGRLATVLGRVVAAADGRPVQGAVVHAIGRRPGGLDPVVTGSSGPDGSFRLDGAAPGDRFVYVHGGGWTSVALGTSRADGPNPYFVRAGASGPLVLAVEPSARVTGRVIDAAGAPVPGARVTTWSGAFGHAVAGTAVPLGAAPFPEAACDAAGRFDLTDLIPGARYEVRASAEGWAQTSCELIAGGPGDVELRLRDSWFVDVRVVAEEDGRAVRGAKVRGAVRNLVETPDFGDAATTDADGRARVGPGPRGEFGVRVDSPDRVRREEPWWVDTVERDGRTFAEVRVPKGLAISGRVVVPEGAPRGRVEITAVEVATEQVVAELRTDTPEFRVERLAPGPHFVAATLGGDDGRRWSGHVRAAAGTSDVVLSLTEEPQAQTPNDHPLVVRVLDDAGEPVFAGNVRAWCHRGAEVLTPGAEVSLGVATLRIPDRVDRIAMDVYVPRDRQGRVLACGAVSVEMPDPRASEFVVRLVRARSIDGRVVGPDGRGVAGARVGAGFVHGPQAPRGVPLEAARTWSAADGTFRLDGLGDGRFWVGAEVPGGWRSPATAQIECGATDVSIVVEPARPVRIVVLGADAAPVEGARVTVKIGGATLAGPTRADGSFVVADVPTGVTAALLISAEARPDLLPLMQTTWMPADATFRLEAAALVSGTIRDARGRPLGGLSVHCRGEGARTWPPVSTDEAGRFVAGRIPPGARVRVFAALPDEDAIEIGEADAGATNLALVFDVGHSLRVRVVNARRGEIEGSVRAFLADGSERYGRFRPDGSALLANLPPDAALRLRIGPTCEHRWAAADGVAPGERDVELTLRDGGTIAGRLEIPESFRGEVNGTAERDGFRVDLEPGQFLARGLAPGTWRVRFFGIARTGESWEGAADLETGSLDAVVRLVPVP